MALLLAKGEDFASWHGVEEFSAVYREAAVKLAAQRHPEGMPQLLELLEGLLVGVKQENEGFTRLVEELEQEISDSSGHAELRTALDRFYAHAYRHFRAFHSPVSFFSMSDRFLKALAAHCLRLARQQIGVTLPPVALIMMGPAGRREATRFCRVQSALVWGNGAPDLLMRQLGAEMITWLRACGVAFEEMVTPLNDVWCGSISQWEERFREAAVTKDRTDLVELLRFADCSVLINEAGVAERFSELCARSLGQRACIANLVERCQSLSNGISMMGGFKLEKSGPHRGAFPLLDHAFLPLSAAVSAICLMNGIAIAGTPQRLRALVRIGKLDVDLAERTLHAWHCFSEHRLTLELDALPGQDCRDILHLLPASLSPAEQERLKTALETVADLQRYMLVVFGAHT